MNTRVLELMENKVFSKLRSIPSFNEINWANLSVQLVQKLGIPLIAIGIFLALWGATASQIKTSLGAVPGPAKVWEQTVVLYDEHVEERVKEDSFYARQEKRNAKKLVKNPDAKVKIREYTGKPTFFDQIITSTCDRRPLHLFIRNVMTEIQMVFLDGMLME